MHRLLFLVLLGPFWLQLACAAGLGYLGYVFQSSEAARITARAALLQTDPPPTIPIADMQQDYTSGGATEVSVTAQIALSHNTRLIKTTNFIKTDEQLLYVLVDPDATLFTDMARAAIVFNSDDLDKVTQWISENAVSFGGDGPVLTVTGLLSGTIRDDMVSDALSDQGMVKGPDFFYITPHFDGRVAALTPKPYGAFLHALWVYAIAAAFVLLGAVKFAMRRLAAAPTYAAPSTATPSVALSGLTGQQIADRLIDEDIARARVEAAFARPLMAHGEPAEPARPAPEVFVVPDPVYVPHVPGPPPVASYRFGDGLAALVRDCVTPKTIAYAGFAVLVGIVTLGMTNGHIYAFNGPPAAGGTEPLTLLLWVGGLIAALVVLKGFVGIPATSQRKGIYDPYLRLAEREQQADAAADRPDNP
jgi:hypothetical protein